jgi:hypothetical protein
VIDLEHRLLKRWTAGAFLKAGVALMAVGFLPILLYAMFGPPDGNPVGLALLMAVLVPVGFLLTGIGLLKWLVARVQRRD